MKRIGFLFLIIIIVCSLLVPSISCSSKEVPVTEPYYETEYRTEYYTVTEKVPELIQTQYEIEPVTS